MRVCRLHREDAIETLRNSEGIEYDLCKECRKMLEEILDGRKEPAAAVGQVRRGRPARES